MSRAPKLIGPVVATVTAVMLGGCALSLQSLPKITGNSNGTYPLHAQFANVLNLPDDAQVRVGAQVVGQVGGISTQNFKADLTLDIDNGVHLPLGTTAQIRFDNPLGDEYVLLTEPGSSTATDASLKSSSGPPASGQFIAPGALIPEEDTSTAPSVEDTFGALSLVLNGGGINQLQTIIHELNNTFNGNQPQIRSFLTTIDTAFTQLANGRASIDRALSSIQNLSSKLNGGRKTIANGINSLAPAIGVLASENGQIDSLISQLSSLGKIGTEVAQQSGENGVNDLRALLPVVQQLESVSAQIGPDLGNLAAFEAESKKVAPGDYLQANVIANVFLPAGAFEPTPLGSTVPAAHTDNSPESGTKAVAGILEGGLL